VIILGDASHKIPPTARQGASQGFEDAFTLAASLPRIKPDHYSDNIFTAWKETRQQHIDRVIQLTPQLNNARLPQAGREKLAASSASVWRSGD
jgi:2-polyprenyl-6-methoxyphenol hydroxylase-like FAD-dependent oxidoreductase